MRNATVERILDPTLRGRPVVVVGVRWGRGVVTSASYEARAFGVRSGTSIGEASERAPADAVFVPGHGEAYSDYSTRTREIVERFSPIVIAASIDEHYEAATLGPLPVRKLPGIGPVAEGKLHAVGVTTLAQLAVVAEAVLRPIFGSYTPVLRRAAIGGGADEPAASARPLASTIHTASSRVRSRTSAPSSRARHRRHPRSCRDFASACARARAGAACSPVRSA